MRTDSQYIRNGASSWRSWRAWGWKGDHVDLWTELAALMGGHASIDVFFAEVVGHARGEQASRGEVNQDDEDGSDAADALAGLAADLHPVPPHLVQRAGWRDDTWCG